MSVLNEKTMAKLINLYLKEFNETAEIPVSGDAKEKSADKKEKSADATVIPTDTTIITRETPVGSTSVDKRTITRSTPELPVNKMKIHVPVERTLQSVDTRAILVDTKATAVDTGAIPVEIGAVHVDIAMLPEDTRAIPVDTRAIPVDTRAIPVDTEEVCVDTAVQTVDTGVKPVDTGVIPLDTSVVPANSMVIGVNTSGIPSELIIINVEDLLMPGDTTGTQSDADTLETPVETSKMPVDPKEHENPLSLSSLSLRGPIQPSQLNANGSLPIYMPKNRPIKSLRLAGQRPFKTYNPFSLFPNSESPLLVNTSLENLPNRLYETITGLMQQQQQQPQRQRTQPQQQQQLAQQSQQQVYGDPGDYLRLNPQQQQQHGLQNTLQQQQGLHNPLLGIDPSMGGYPYDDLDLVDPENSLMRSDLLGNESLIQQREQDLNIASLTSTSSSLSAVPNFIIPNRGILNRPSSNNLGLGGQDPLSMLFDTPMSFGSSLQQNLASLNPTSIGSCSTQPFSQNTSLFQISGMTTPTNGNGRASSSSTMSSSASLTPTSSIVNHYPVKQEADEGHSTIAETPSPSSMSSPQRSETGAEGFGEPKKGSLKRSVSESSAASAASPHDKPSTSHGDENGSEDGVKSEDTKDLAYLEKRRKNNESAKRSREARRTKEELVAFRVITLEEENMKLRAEIRLLDKELEELRQRLYCS